MSEVLDSVGNIVCFYSLSNFIFSTAFTHTHACTHAHTHTRLMALCPGLPRWAGTRKVKPIWILLKQETVSGSWAICKSAHRCRQITTPTSYHSVFTGRMPFLAPNQQCQSTEGTVLHLVIHYLCEMTPILDLMFGCVSRNLKCFYKNKTCDTLAKAQILSVAHRAGMQKFLWLLPLDGCCWHRAHSLFLSTVCCQSNIC